MSPRPTSRHRPLLVRAAQDLFLAGGYAGTSVDAICEAAGVTKGSFYHQFSSKEDIAVAAIEDYYTQVETAFLGFPAPADGEPRAVLDAFLGHAVDVSRGPLFRDGCVLGTLAVDLAKTNPTIREAISTRFERLTGVLSDAIRAAAAGDVPGLDPKVQARQFLAVLEGAIVLGRAHDEPALLVEALGCYRLNLMTILRR